jgi:hypothetical protein
MAASTEELREELARGARELKSATTHIEQVKDYEVQRALYDLREAVGATNAVLRQLLAAPPDTFP